MSSSSGRLLRIVVLSLFLLSGISSLVYQIVWTRMLVLVFGNTLLATSTVLSAFMAGLMLQETEESARRKTAPARPGHQPRPCPTASRPVID